MGDLFSGKNSLEQRTHKLGASQNMGAFFQSGALSFSGENSLEQRTHKLGASKNMGAVNTCKATRFSRMVQKWSMHFSNALNCEANAQGP